MEVAARAFDAVAPARIKRAGQPVNGVVGNGQRVVHVFGSDEGQHGAEDLFLCDAGLRIHVGDNGGLDEVTFVGQPVAFAAYNDAALLFADLNVFTDLFERTTARNRAGEVADVFDIADGQLFGAFGDFAEHFVVDRIHHDRARAGRTLLARKAEGRHDDAFGRGV